jgi:antitoxin Phd
MEWNLAEAKNRLSEVVNRALTEGPQTIHRRKDTVMVVSAEDFERLAGQRRGFKEFLTQGESFEGLDLGRDPSPGRDASL